MNFKDVRRKLDQVSPSFCIAKWKQVTLYLQNGQTHSCHHPGTHHVPVSEVLANPDAIHNSGYKMQRRKEMLEGKRPEECEYCWKIEDLSPDLLSDRLLKSGDDWALPALDEVRTQPWDYRVKPSYVEVSFSNTCNFKCAYCAPILSSKWAEELREFGPYANAPNLDLENLEATKRTPIPESEPNPYVDAFWKWWPELYPELKVFRITGGEPLLTKHTFRVLDYVRANPNPALDLAVNSNLGAPQKLIDQFATSVEALIVGKKVKSFQLYTSIDTWGEQAEYIRTGMDFESFWSRIRELLIRIPKMKIGLMCTVNVMSVPRLHQLLEGVGKLKAEFRDPDSGEPRVTIDFPYLMDPEFLSAKILPPEFAAHFKKFLDFIAAHRGIEAFSTSELQKMERLVTWFAKPVDEAWLRKQRAIFFQFISSYDQRRNLSFARTFPELKQFFDICRLEFAAAAASGT